MALPNPFATVYFTSLKLTLSVPEDTRLVLWLYFHRPGVAYHSPTSSEYMRPHNCIWATHATVVLLGSMAFRPKLCLVLNWLNTCVVLVMAREKVLFIKVFVFTSQYFLGSNWPLSVVWRIFSLLRCRVWLVLLHIKSLPLAGDFLCEAAIKLLFNKIIYTARRGHIWGYLVCSLKCFKQGGIVQD